MANEKRPDNGAQLSAAQKKQPPQPQQQHEKQWTNPIEFLMTCIGFAVSILF